MDTVRLCSPKGSLPCLQTVLKRSPADRVCLRQPLDFEGNCGVCVWPTGATHACICCVQFSHIMYGMPCAQVCLLAIALLIALLPASSVPLEVTEYVGNFSMHVHCKDCSVQCHAAEISVQIVVLRSIADGQ